MFSSKRLLDILISSLLLLIMLPLLCLITLMLTILYRGNPFFLHLRPGLDEKCFRMLKFRTMNEEKDAAGNLLPAAERLTPLGRFLRKTSLDELPQLFNVLIGQMSLIGPRPLHVDYLPLYNAHQHRRHEVKPGITGWAQVNGRNTITWQQKFEYDVWYVDHCSFALDLKILLLTLQKVLKKEGINQAGQATAERFKGVW